MNHQGNRQYDDVEGRRRQAHVPVDRPPEPGEHTELLEPGQLVAEECELLDEEVPRGINLQRSPAAETSVTSFRKCC